MNLGNLIDKQQIALRKVKKWPRLTMPTKRAILIFLNTKIHTNVSSEA